MVARRLHEPLHDISIKKMIEKPDKLKRYNQVLLAIISTMALLFVLIGGIMALSVIYDELSWKNQYTEPSIIADRQTDQMLGDSVRKQLISFERLILLDTVKQIYMLPVKQANLADAEYIDDSDLLGLTNSFTVSVGNSNYYGNGQFYNNILIWDKISGSMSELFKTRVSINYFDRLKLEEGEIVVMSVSNMDTNSDGRLNRQDLQMLCIYHVPDNRLIQVKANNRTHLRLEKLYESDDLIGLFGTDKNENGEFNKNTEPRFFYRIDLGTGNLELLVKEEPLLRLQKRLDGRLK